MHQSALSQEDEILRDLVSSVAGFFAFDEVVAKERAHANRAQCIEVGDDLTGALQRIPSFNGMRDRFPVHQRKIENGSPRMLMQRADVVGGG